LSGCATVWPSHITGSREERLDIERAFLSKVAVSGQIEKALASGIRDNHFPKGVMRDVYGFLAEHSRTYNGPPSMTVVREQFPDFNFEATTDSLEYLTHRFVKDVKRKYAKNSLLELARQLEDDPEDIDGLLLAEARRLAMLIPSSGADSFKNIDERIDSYKNGESVEDGILMGIPEIDRLTGGIQPHELVTISGWQGTGKSTLTQYVLFNAWKQGRSSLVFSLEMTGKALMRKWDTMLTNFEYHALKTGKLSPEDLELWQLKAKEVREGTADIVVKSGIRGCTPDYVYAEIVRHQPDIVAIDYISLMELSRSASDTQHWQVITYLTQNLKQIALSTGTPILAVAQTNINSAKDGAKLENISYSRSIGQDSDIVLGLHQNEEMKEEKKMAVRMLKNRDGSTCETGMLWDMNTMRFMDWNDAFYFVNKNKRERINTETGEIIGD